MNFEFIISHFQPGVVQALAYSVLRWHGERNKVKVNCLTKRGLEATIPAYFGADRNALFFIFKQTSITENAR